MNGLYELIEKSKEKYINDLIEFLHIPSISSDTNYKHEVARCSDWLANHLKSIGIDRTTIIPTAGHPIVFAEYKSKKEGAKTVMVYGHYDVQPVDPLEEWISPPFEPEIRNGKIFARGSSDDKGQLFTHIKAFEAYTQIGELPVNLKFLIEGEEEAAMNNLEPFIRVNKELLECDAILISDTEWFSDNVPSICYSLRGIGFVELTVYGPNRDLHSGSFGGSVDNPIIALSYIISRLKDRYGRITIPGFYDDVKELEADERIGFSKLDFDENKFYDDIGLKLGFGEIGFTTLERIWARPALDINGIVGGYTGEGSKTIIPAKASAKISIRLVPNQRADDIIQKTIEYIKRIAPPTVKIEIKHFAGANPVLIDRNSYAIKSAYLAIKNAFGKEPVFVREGGSIPIVEQFVDYLNKPVVLMGLGLPGDNIHSPNENFDLNNYIGGIKASANFYDEFSKF